MTILRNIWYSFPFRLVQLHLKKQLFLLFFWLLLIGLITHKIGGPFGINYLFLDPEYMGHVGGLSFLMMGIAFGVFVIVFQITSYILNAYRFPFLATLNSPFFSYSMNNSLIPLFFGFIYLLMLARFQSQSELAEGGSTLFNLLAFTAGSMLVFLVAGSYFFTTNKNILHIIGRSFKKGKEVSVAIDKLEELKWEKVQQRMRVWQVSNFISRRFRIRPVRGVDHYDERDLLAVFRQHHTNAIMVELMALAFLVFLGYFIDNPLFMIPAGASLMILLATLMMLIGAFSYWTAGWRSTVFILLMIFVSLLIRFNIVSYQNPAYGLDYSGEKPAYNARVLSHLNTPQTMLDDQASTLQILNQWKAKFPNKKPKMIFINASGGGLRAALWSMQVLRMTDSMSQRQLMKHTILMAGASGGMLGVAYFRELVLENQLDKKVNPFDKKHLIDIAGDLLNPVTFAIAVNDLFYPWRKFNYGSYTYRKDRAYMFEKQFNLNTHFRLDKPLIAYRKPEREARIPMLILTPTIIQDERKLYISPQKLSYLSCPAGKIIDTSVNMIDGVDFGSLLKQQDAYNLRFLTALRMNATYPYIMPTVVLPTRPPLEIMDAGIRDNFGMETSVRFIFNFKDWIKENTSGVIFISINSVNKEMLSDDAENNRNIITQLFSPIGNLYNNWPEIQHYNQLYLAQYAREWLDGKLEFIAFNYIPGKIDRAASLSWHLTTREKQDIQNAFYLDANQASMSKLLKAL